MKKYMFRTILVLAALTACNKEIDNQTPLTVDPVDEAPAGKVTLTFKATVGEDTRTVYASDKNGTWEAGDEISVCVTDGENFEIVDFTTEDGETFSAEVSDGYTTIASAVYPANDAYATFPGDYFFITGDEDDIVDGHVIGLYLTNVLEMGASTDQGTLIPMVGSFDASTQTMSFHHVCGALKVTLSNIPADACYFTFHANNQQLVYDFPLTSDGRIELGTPVEGNDDMDLVFHFTAGSETTRSFYIPIPDGTLASGAYVTLENEDLELLYKKVLSKDQEFDKNQIKRLPETACWTRDDNWQVTYLYDLFNETKVKSYVRVSGTTGYYGISAFTKADFESSFDSIADFLLSINSSSHYTANGIIKFNYKFSATDYIAIVYGLDKNNKFSGFYNCIDFTVPEFFTPSGWSITVNENYNNSGNIITVANVKVPEGNTWSYNSVSKEEFTNSYGGDPAAFIWSKRNGTSSLSTGKNVNYNVNSLRGDYVLISYGMNERASAEDSRTPTFEYCLIEYTFEEPSQDYLSWIGTWTVTDSKSTPNVDTWTISRKQANHLYSVSGMNGNLFTAIANYDATNNRIVFQSQLVGTTNTYDYYLFGSSTTATNAVRQTEEPYDVMYVEESADGIQLNGFTLPDNTLCSRYYRINYNRSTSAWTYTNARYIPSTLTRVTE